MNQIGSEWVKVSERRPGMNWVAVGLQKEQTKEGMERNKHHLED